MSSTAWIGRVPLGSAAIAATIVGGMNLYAEM